MSNAVAEIRELTFAVLAPIVALIAALIGIFQPEMSASQTGAAVLNPFMMLALSAVGRWKTRGRTDPDVAVEADTDGGRDE